MDKNQETKKGFLTANLEDWEFRRLYERQMVAESFIVRIEDAMNEQQITKTELARRMECSAANISRAMRKTTNMTLATLVDMGLSLNFRVKIELEPLALNECAFQYHTKLAEPTWSPLKVDVSVTPDGWIQVFRLKERGEVEALRGGASASWAFWDQQSVDEAEATCPLLA